MKKDNVPHTNLFIAVYIYLSSAFEESATKLIEQMPSKKRTFASPTLLNVNDYL